jgi:hypothetical protein
MSTKSKYGFLSVFIMVWMLIYIKIIWICSCISAEISDLKPFFMSILIQKLKEQYHDLPVVVNG